MPCCGAGRISGTAGTTQHKNGSPIRSFVRVPSLEGFADAALACQAAEILAEWDMAQGHGHPAR